MAIPNMIKAVWPLPDLRNLIAILRGSIDKRVSRKLIDIYQRSINSIALLSIVLDNIAQVKQKYLYGSLVCIGKDKWSEYVYTLAAMTAD